MRCFLWIMTREKIWTGAIGRTSHGVMDPLFTLKPTASDVGLEPGSKTSACPRSLVERLCCCHLVWLPLCVFGGELRAVATAAPLHVLSILCPSQKNPWCHGLRISHIPKSSFTFLVCPEAAQCLLFASTWNTRETWRGRLTCSPDRRKPQLASACAFLKYQTRQIPESRASTKSPHLSDAKTSNRWNTFIPRMFQNGHC